MQPPKEQIQPLPPEETYKKITAEDVSKMIHPRNLAQPTSPGKPFLTRFFTLISANIDLVALAFLLLCVFILGYLARCLQENLTADQIRMGIEAFVEILITVFFTTAALFLKLLTKQGAISRAFACQFENFRQKIETRKNKIDQGKVSPFGRSIESK